MRRRRFIMLLAGGAVAGWPLAAPAQQRAKLRRIGYLGFGSASASANWVEALQAGLRDLGYVEGENIVIEFRWADTVEQLHILAAELVRMNVEIIFALSSTEVEPARQATKTIPIVFATNADPVGLGHVASLPRPGGNITGLSVQLTEIVVKQLEILKEALPRATRIGVLFSPTAPSHRPALQAIEAAAEKLGVQLHMVPVQAVENFEEAFVTMARERVGGFLAVGAQLFNSQQALLAELALKHLLPGMVGNNALVEAGGLMTYAADTYDMTRRSAAYIDKILKGAKPADLPVQQPARFQLVINLKTAKALGLTIPLSILARADKVIE
jgi:putative tryptophan/tyrosine transport system substrate-binding protein